MKKAKVKEKETASVLALTLAAGLVYYEMVVELASVGCKFKWRKIRICNLVQRMMRTAGLSDSWLVGLELAGRARMRFLNHKFRHKNKTTDILSFKLSDHESTCFARVEDSDVLQPLGEIILCPSVIFSRIRSRSYHDLDRRIERLLAHGLGHLMGHDHHEVEECRKMQVLESRILRSLFANEPVEGRLCRSRFRSQYIAFETRLG